MLINVKPKEKKKGDGVLSLWKEHKGEEEGGWETDWERKGMGK